MPVLLPPAVPAVVAPLEALGPSQAAQLRLNSVHRLNRSGSDADASGAPGASKKWLVNTETILRVPVYVTSNVSTSILH